MRVLSWYLFTLVLRISVLSPVQIEIVTLLPYNFGVPSATIWTGAAFELAVQAANKMYAPSLNVSMRLIYNTSHRNCEDLSSDAIRMLSEHYYMQPSPQTVRALVTSPCTDSKGIESIATGWDLLLFANGLAQEDFLNHRITPTAVSISGSFHGYAFFLLKLLTFYHWSHVTVVQQAHAFSPFYGGIASALAEHARKNTINDYTFVMDRYIFDHDNHSMTEALCYVKNRSRVMVIAAPVSIALEFLVGYRVYSFVALACILLTSNSLTYPRTLQLMADAVGMANGEFVFINVQPVQQVGFGFSSLFNHPPLPNISAFRSLIFVAIHTVGRELQNLSTEIAKRTKLLYNRTYETGSQPLDSFTVQASFDIVDILTTIVNETAQSKDPHFVWSGGELRNLMSNRTYSVTTGDVYISDSGERFLDVDIFGFCTETNTMKPIGQWNGATQRLLWSNARIDWPTPTGRPPLDIPPCGFSGMAGFCAQKSSTLMNILLPVAVTISLSVGLLLFIRYQYEPTEWEWLILYQDIVFPCSWDAYYAPASSCYANWSDTQVFTESATLNVSQIEDSVNITTQLQT